MGLCGGFRCGCGLTSTPATSGAINGELPTINVSGSGEPGDPYDIGFNDNWSALVAEGIIRPLIGASWRRDLSQSIPHATLTTVSRDFSAGPTAGFLPSGQPLTIPAGLGGVYLMTALIRYPTTSLGAHFGAFSINLDGSLFYPFAGTTGSAHQAGTIVTALSAGDTVALQTRHSNGSSQNITAQFEIYRLPADNPIVTGL